MAPRSFLLCVCFTIGLLTSWSSVVAGLDIGVSFLVEPRDVVAVRNKPALLECSARSTLGPVSVGWTLNGQPLPLDDAGAAGGGRRTLLANGSLLIRKVVAKRSGPHDGPDQGQYRCVATVAGAHIALVSRPALLRVAALSHNFTEFPSNELVEVGSTVRFACQIESVPTVVVTWEKNQIPLPLNSRYILLDSGVLLISAAEFLDAGSYRCVASNLLTNKQRTSPEWQLRVNERAAHSAPLTFLSPPASSTASVAAGHNLTLECSATGWPAPRLVWTRDPPPPAAADNTTVSAAGVALLTLTRVDARAAGNYTCTAAGGGGGGQVVTVAVVVPPTVVKGPLSQVYPTAKTVRFECEVEGVPTPDVVWVKDGMPLKINGRIKQRPTELLLSNTVTDDSGLYQCVARNAGGEAWVAGRLLVNASRHQPEPPHDLSCTAKSPTQVELTWRYGQAGESDIKAYTIHYLPTAGGEERQDVSVNKTWVVEKLSAYTNYTFYARAYSVRSASDQSPRVVCQTGEGVPVGAPALTVDATSATTLLLSWRPLSNDKARGLVTEYKIQWRRKGNPSSNVDQVMGDVLQYTVTGLHPGKRYEARVLAATSQGWPDLSDDQLPWTPLEMPTHGQQPAQPAPTVELTVVNLTCIDVTWRLPADSGYRPGGYKLYYRKQNGQAVGPVQLGANVTQYLLTGLDPNEWYEVHVVGWTSEGEGSRGVKSIHTLPLMTPGGGATPPPLTHLEPPTGVEADPTAPTVIYLTWSPPAHSENISYYTISYGPVANGELASYLRSTSNRVEMGNLRPYTLYEFKVRSHDAQGRYGEYSQTVECHTQEDIPGVVQDVQWKALNSTAARVAWKAPDKTNGIIGAYLVAFSSDTGTPADQWRSQRVVAPKTSADLLEIVPNVRYFLSVRAETRAGLGPPTGVLTLLIIPSVNRATPLPPFPTQGSITDQHLGIMLGAVIGFGCIFGCGLAFMGRRRCARSAVPEAAGQAGGAANGKGCCRDRRAAAGHELELLSDPACTQIQPVHIPPSNHAHLDTKGGVGSYPNGLTNGLTNGRIPNGHGVRDRLSVRITENPQFSRQPPPPYTPCGGSTPHQEQSEPLLPPHAAGLADGRAGDGAGGGGPLEGAGANDSSCESSNGGNWTQLTTLDDSALSRRYHQYSPFLQETLPPQPPQ